MAARSSAVRSWGSSEGMLALRPPTWTLLIRTTWGLSGAVSAGLDPVRKSPDGLGQSPLQSCQGGLPSKVQLLRPLLAS